MSAIKVASLAIKESGSMPESMSSRTFRTVLIVSARSAQSSKFNIRSSEAEPTLNIYRSTHHNM